MAHPPAQNQISPKKNPGEKVTVIAEFSFRASGMKISATSRASGVRALARDNFKYRLSAEIADSDFVASAMTVIQIHSSNSITTRRLRFPFFSIFVARIFPTSPVRDKCVPPHA